jgi:FkbM family methyltransferase
MYTYLNKHLIKILQKLIVPLVFKGREIDWFRNYSFAASDLPKILVRLRRFIWKQFLELEEPTDLTVTWLSGIKLRLRMGNDLSECMFVGGCYEPNEMAFINLFLKPGMTFIDIGANEGFFSLFAKSCVGQTGRVIAFEPSPRDYDRLCQNQALNPTLELELHNFGLSDRRHSETLHLAEPRHSGHNTLGNFAYDIEEANRVEIELRTLDDVWLQQSWQSVEMLKIDTEGSELQILRGASQIIKSFRPVVLVEVVPKLLEAQSASAEALQRLLYDAGYSLFVFGSTGKPRQFQALPSEGANILAIPSDKLYDVTSFLANS